MNYKQLQQLNEIIENLKTHPHSDENIQFVLDLADNSVQTETLKELISKTKKKSPTKGKICKIQEGGIWNLSKKEIQKMPLHYQNIFACEDKIITYRFHNGVYEARYRREGFNIEVSSKQLETMKRKFIQALHDYANGLKSCPKKAPSKRRSAHAITFAEYGEEWLKIKEQTTKPSTFKEYSRLFEHDLRPAFGMFRLDEITRAMLQNYLFSFINKGKHRTAKKLKLQLSCIFDMASEDFSLPSPVKKIVLPYHESKKGSAFTKTEERQLVEYCISNPDGATTSALLVLLYFGLRQSELASLRIIDGKYLECETSKERMGRNIVLRRIPFTPIAKRVIPYIDWDKARETNTNSISSTIKRLFPNHHPHELRYTFITRCKECGVNPELVMLWDGHSFDKDVKTSAVDRGYTDYSEEYILAEAEKVNYKF